MSECPVCLSLIHISEPTRLLSISYAVFCLKKNKKINLDYVKDKGIVTNIPYFRHDFMQTHQLLIDVQAIVSA